MFGGYTFLTRLGQKSSRLGVGPEDGFRYGCNEFGIPGAISGEATSTPTGIWFRVWRTDMGVLGIWKCLNPYGVNEMIKRGLTKGDKRKGPGQALRSAGI